MKTDNPESSVSNQDQASNRSGEKLSASETTVTGQVSSMVDSAKEPGAHVLDEAKKQAASRVDQQRQTLASGIKAVGHAFQSMGEDLRQKDQGPIGKYAAEMGQAIGGQVEQLATYLRDRDVRQLIRDTEDFARRSPAVFLGSAFVVGLAASRFLKSSHSLFARATPQPLNPGPSTPGTQPALPPASAPPAAADSSTPSGFPFEPREPLASPASPTLTATNPSGKGPASR